MKYIKFFEFLNTLFINHSLYYGNLKVNSHHADHSIKKLLVYKSIHVYILFEYYNVNTYLNITFF